jgi:hypothetical protein
MKSKMQPTVEKAITRMPDSLLLSHAPQLGEQTRDILSDLRVDDAEIDRLEGRNEANQKTLEALQAGRA